MPCIVELLSIGNELLLGNTVNTNASWIAAQITIEGGQVTRITTIPDDIQEIVKAIRETLKRRPDFVITTGGIGPTFDDMTLNAVAKSIHNTLRLDPKAVNLIKQHYLRRFDGVAIKLTKPRLKMARIPSSAIAITNPIGTAPAVRLRAGGTEIFCLPGVPREAKAIFKNSIAILIRSKAKGKRFIQSWIEVRGIMESTLAPIIDETIHKWPAVYIKSHPRGFEQASPRIDVHFSITTVNFKRGKQTIDTAVKHFKQQIMRLRRESKRSDGRTAN